MSQPDPIAPLPPSGDSMLVRRAERPGFCVANLGPLIVAIWTRTAVGEHVDLIGEAQREILREHGKCAVISIIRAELSMSVDDEVRAKGQDNIRDFGDSTVRNVLVVEAGGLRASFFRSVVTGLYFLTRKSSAQKVCSNLTEAVEWSLEPFAQGEEGANWPDLDVALVADEVNRFADAFTYD